MIITKLANGKSLEDKNRDHQLINFYGFKNARECHIEPDWLLIYIINNKRMVLTLLRTGSHTDLFD